MKAHIQIAEEDYHFDLSQPIDISIPIGQVTCFYSTPFKATPYRNGDFVGAVKEGAPVNFFDVQMNPHGNGTHTECLGHITIDQESVDETLTQFHFVAQVISVSIEEKKNGDHVITEEQLRAASTAPLPEAVVLRTMPNSKSKLYANYSGTNPPYMESAAMSYLVEQGVKHLLLDLPSVDREEDEGILAAHHIFWNVDGNQANASSRSECTITEMIFVPNEIKDGLYLLNLQIPSMNLDAAPSKPVLYQLNKETE
jgi:kynurenine formamidase